MTWSLQVQHWMEVLILTTFKNNALTWTRTAVYTDDDQSSQTIIKQQKRFSHRMSVQNSQNWEVKPIPCTRKCKLLSRCFFLKSECRISMCQLATKALVGMAQNIIGLKTCFSVKPQLCKPKPCTRASCWDSFSGYFSQSLCLEKPLLANTTKTTWSSAVHHTLRLLTKSVAENLGEFPTLWNFFS